MESEPSNQISVPKRIKTMVKVYAAKNDMSIKDVVAIALESYVSRQDEIDVVSDHNE